MISWLEDVPLLSEHSNGDRVFGTYPDVLSEVLYAAGTPPVSSLYRKSITPLIADVRIGDDLAAIFDGQFWWAGGPNGDIGRLTWSRNMTVHAHTGAPIHLPPRGRLEVHRVFVDEADNVVNLGGIVYPVDA